MTTDRERVAHRIKEEVSREIGNLRHEVSQIRNLVQDAIVKLTDSFNGLRDQSNTQSSLVNGLISSMESSGDEGRNGHQRINIREFISETDQILRQFVDHIVMVSRQSMEMVHRIDDLADQMHQVVNLLKDVRSIAEQTNVLALNARIVAARAGDAGLAFAVVADEVRKLSRHSNRFSDRINEVVSGAQGNITGAKDIIEAMASKDMSFAIQSKGRVDEMMGEISEIDKFTASTLSRVSSITEELNRSVGLAIMSLQFEDMVTQLSSTIDKKLTILDEFGQNLCCGCLDARKGDGVEQVQGVLEDQIRRFDEADRKAVQQASMDEGDIELF